MRRFQWKSKQTAGLLTAAAVLFLLLRTKSYSHYDSVNLPRIKPKVVWEYVADFSNMKHLNPTIIDFDILSESGNYDHWKYQVKYSENLSHLPYLLNVGVAQFDVKAGPGKEVYYINSLHTTCLFYGQFCLNSWSEFKFSNGPKTNDGALCEEAVNYECPTLFSSFCRREVEFQRREIMKSLKLHFATKKL